MISHKHKCIFIHIPKAAGTSIETAFGHFDSWSKKKAVYGREGQDHRSVRMLQNPLLQLKAFTSKENIIEVLKSIRYRYEDHSNINNKLTVTPKQYQTYFKFTIVRNPWDRVFSCYRNMMKDEIHRNEIGAPKDLDFNQFVSLHLDTYLLRPQTYWIKNFSGKVDLDYICRFENLNQDFEKVCQLLNLSGIKLPHKLKNKKRDYRQEYNRKSIQLVKQKYQEEIEIFGYTFDKNYKQVSMSNRNLSMPEVFGNNITEAF